jgi:short-subunit dehydrogenase
MDLGIKGKWALVCGASKGLGIGCAQALVKADVNVLIVARGSVALEQAAAGRLSRLGPRALAPSHRKQYAHPV